jgi:hypothetical protein
MHHGARPRSSAIRKQRTLALVTTEHRGHVPPEGAPLQHIVVKLPCTGNAISQAIRELLLL